MPLVEDVLLVGLHHEEACASALALARFRERVFVEAERLCDGGGDACYRRVVRAVGGVESACEQMYVYILYKCNLYMHACVSVSL